MRKCTVVAALLAAITLPATAQTMVEDTDGDGAYSIEELTVAYPDLSEELFGEVDANSDGVVDAEELTAAQEDGILGG